MSWFGTILGSSIGFLFGGPLGAIGGAALGHIFLDRRGGGATGGGGQRGGAGRGGFYAHQQRQAGYFVALFSLIGKIAAADGKVTGPERRLVEQFLDQSGVYGQQRQFALNIFSESAASPHSVEELARQFAQLSGQRRDFQLNFMDFLVRLASIDGTIDMQEKRMLNTIATALNIPGAELEHLCRRWSGASGGGGSSSSSGAGGAADPYKILGCTPASTDSEIKSTYRKLASAYHPDKIIAKELPEEFTQLANEKFQEIQNAYQTIRKQRGIR